MQTEDGHGCVPFFCRCPALCLQLPRQALGYGLNYANNDTAMCQLLGMNCNTPTDVRFSFSGFTQRAGNTGDHTDGWGIAFFEDKGLRHFVGYERAIDSPIAKLIREYPDRKSTRLNSSHLVISYAVFC